jgi:fatty-acyl-CoA synthase
MSAAGIDGTVLTFGQFLDAVGERYADRPAIVSSDHSFATPSTIRRTYREFAADVQALQAGLTEAGVCPGEHVAVILSSFYEWVLYLFAVTRLGAAFVPLNPRFGSRELAHVLSHSGSGTLVAMGRYLGRDYAALIQEVVGQWTPGRGAANLPNLRRILGVRTMPHPEALDTETLLARGRASVITTGAPPPTKDVESTAILFYTSGTTAFPKGVPLTHRNLLPHSIGCGGLLDLTAHDRVLTLYPFFGISGGANKVLSTFAFGACLVFQDAFRAEEAFELLCAEQCTVVHAVDVQIRELVRFAHERPGIVPERRGTIAFMAGLDEALAREMTATLGLQRFVHPYGMTETNPMVLRNHPDDPFEVRLRPGGRPAPLAQVRVVDTETGKEMETDVPGEIEVRGETVMKGYYRDPGATAAAFRDGWFRTGDQGVRTQEGYVFYLGRLKDMLKIGGFNVAPQEVEAFLRSHAGVDDVAVTGLPDARLGEVVVAFVKPRVGPPVDEAAILNFCRGRIANFKIPQHVVMVDELPYHIAANGSKLKRDVVRAWARERFLDGHAPLPPLEGPRA